MNEKSVSKQIFETLLRQRNLLLISVGVGAVLSMIMVHFVPKTYKVTSGISIQTQYFQVPMLRDFLSETFDGQELKSQREALIYRALNQKYLKELGVKYKLFGRLTEEEISTDDLNQMMKSFEVIQAGGSTYVIGFKGNDPETAYKVLQDVIAHLRATMSEERRNSLIRVHDSLQSQLEVLSFHKQNNDMPMMASRPDLVKQEIERIQEQIQVLKARFSDQHPKVGELTRRLVQLNSWLKQTGNASSEVITATRQPVVFTGEKVDPTSKDLFQDLLKKYHYLEVAINLDQQNQETYLSVLQEPYVPRSAIWPKRSIFLLWGVVVGFLIGSFVALFNEAKAGNALLQFLNISQLKNRFNKSA